MQIHILMFEDNIEKASMDGRKMQELADEMNGGPPGFEIVGPYHVVSVELEDAIPATDWIEKATKMFHQYRKESNKYEPTHKDVIELCLINAGKAIALSELLEEFGIKPEI